MIEIEDSGEEEEGTGSLYIKDIGKTSASKPTASRSKLVFKPNIQRRGSEDILVALHVPCIMNDTLAG